ncbi:MAG: histidine kinase, partial [Ginsengibacter sp.]
TLYDFHPFKNKLFIFSNIQMHPLRFKVDSIRAPESIFDFTITNTLINFYTNSGKIYVYNKKKFQLEFIFDENYAHNALYNDSKGDIWVGTIDKGLLLYKKNIIDYVKMPRDYGRTNFISIARKPDGTLLAGNYYGEILEKKGNIFKINSFTNGENGVFRQRKILLSQNKIFTFSEKGIFENYINEITFLNSTVYAKTACTYDDTTIIIGQVGRILKLNTRTGKLILVFKPSKRVTALSRGMDGSFYSGSTDGLYKYNFLNGSSQHVLPDNFLLKDRITAICTSEDSVLWVGTAGNGLIGLKDDQVIFHITEKGGLINNSTRSLTVGKAGQLWLGTSGGLSVIRYQLQKKIIRYAIQNLTVNDGLTSNIINDIFYDNDSVYAATGEGISIIPANIFIPKFNIPVQLIRVSINQRDTIITRIYNLNYNQQDIQVQVAGIELGGHLKNIQYVLDENKNWITITGNILTLRLNSGKHLLQIRAIDVNGNISNQILPVQFNIATPFWKEWWFWILLLLLLQVIVFHSIIQKQKKKREAKLAKEIASVQTAALKQQAFTSLMNPHFMFNALNSIQHYINTQDRRNANRYLSDFASLIRKNFEAAQQSFISMEQEIENIKLYFRLEQMRFSNRFSYEINISQAVDIEDWRIPNMMLQPFLENALLHGIMPSNIDGKIIIDFKLEKEDLVITITDNGIGVANSRSLKTNNGHKSRGMELIEKRIAALSHFGKQPITLHSAPASDDAENPGNKITLLIPADLYQAWLKAQQK